MNERNDDVQILSAGMLGTRAAGNGAVKRRKELSSSVYRKAYRDSACIPGDNNARQCLMSRKKKSIVPSN
jgi:hypothetical protein